LKEGGRDPYLAAMIRTTTIGLLTSTALIAGLHQATAQCCDYTISMQDSYGDGWNGGYLTVLVNNVEMGTFAATGTGSSATFNLCHGDALEVQYTAADWEEENTYQIFDPQWNLVQSGGPNIPVGTVYSGFGNCLAPLVVGGSPCTAIAIGPDTCLVSDNLGMPGTGMNPGCANYQGGDRWFVLTVPPSGSLTFKTDSGSINDTGLALWTANNCTAPGALACDDDGAGIGYFSMILPSDLQPGSTVYVQVFGYGGATGTFRLCITDNGFITLASSELPIFHINTLGNPIVNDVKSPAMLDIRYNGPGNLTYMTDPPNVYSGNIGIEVRGATSSGFPQKPFNLETRTPDGQNNNVALLGMPAENDWVLLSNFNDRSLIRNTLAFDLFGQMGHYSVRTALCEVFIDSIYRGIYVFGEKIKRDQNRVNLATLLPTDVAGDELTGGYILQQNYWNDQNSFQSNYSPIDHPGFDVHFLYHQPAPDELVPAQKQYIASYLDSLETALYSPGFADTATGYRKFMSVRSFIDYFIINEVSRNNDGFKKSVYFHKDKFSNGGKLKAGPVWDFDWAWKNLWSCDLFSNIDGSGWAHLINDCPTDNYSTGWYIRLMQDTSYNNQLRCIYEQYRTTILSTAHINSYIDSVGALVQNAQARHFQKWPILGMSGPAPEVNAIATTYAAELDTLKSWIATRLAWLDANIPGTCWPDVSTGTLKQNVRALNCHPNPSTGTVQLSGTALGGTAHVHVSDATGRIVQMNDFANTSTITLQIPNPGLYHITVIDANGEAHQRKVVIVRE
jgi:hypothetical protein